MAEKRKYKVEQKMTSGGPRVYRKWGEWQAGDIVVGKFIAKGIDQYKKPQWVLEVLEVFFKNKKAEKDIVGKNLALNSCGILDKAMANTAIGKIVQVSYMGTSTITKGQFEGEEAHTMEVDIVTEENEDEDLDL